MTLSYKNIGFAVAKEKSNGASPQVCNADPAATNMLSGKDQQTQTTLHAMDRAMQRKNCAKTKKCFLTLAAISLLLEA